MFTKIFFIVVGTIALGYAIRDFVSFKKSLAIGLALSLFVYFALTAG